MKDFLAFRTNAYSHHHPDRLLGGVVICVIAG